LLPAAILKNGFCRKTEAVAKLTQRQFEHFDLRRVGSYLGEPVI